MQTSGLREVPFDKRPAPVNAIGEKIVALLKKLGLEAQRRLR
jgi:hypothetical protein